MDKKTDSFIFYRSFFDAVLELSDAKRLQTYDAICKFALDNEEVLLKSGAKVAMILIKPQLVANKKRRIDGAKGGRPVAEKITTGYGEGVTTGYGDDKPNGNGNPNVNGNDNPNQPEPPKKKKRKPEETRVTPEWLKKIKENYPKHDVDKQLQKARGWILGNKGRQLTRRFFSNWMVNAEPEDEGGFDPMRLSI